MHPKVSYAISFARAHKQKFAKYFFVGITGLALDLGLLYIASDLWGIRPFYAVFVTQIIVIVYNFLLNRNWSFQSSCVAHRQFMRFGAVLAFNYLFGAGAMYFGNEVLGIHEQAVRIITVALAVAWNYPLYNYWVYKE